MADLEDTIDYSSLIKRLQKDNPDLQFNAELGEWIQLSGHRWQPAQSLAEKVTSEAYHQNSHKKKANLTLLQQAFRTHVTDPRPVNRDARMLLNTSTGIVDLAERKKLVDANIDPNTQVKRWFSPHPTDRYDDRLLTEITNAAYVPNHSPKPEKFIAFLADFFQHDKATINYFWKYLASLLTGDTSDHGFFVIFGSGANGKSTLLRVLEGVLGTYVAKVDPSLLQAKTDTTIDGIKLLYKLRFKRLLILDEPPANMILDVPFMKRITGEDSMPSPRRTRKSALEQENFNIEAKIIMDTNHLPKIQHVEDNGLWRRFTLLPARPPVPIQDRDPGKTNELLEEIDLILTHLIDHHFDRWDHERIKNPPQKVSVASTMFRFLSDPIRFFIKTNCRVTQFPLEKSMTVQSEKLWHHYLTFCREMSVQIASHLGLVDEGQSPFLIDITSFGSNKHFSRVLEENYGALKGVLAGRHYWKNVLFTDVSVSDKLLEFSGATDDKSINPALEEYLRSCQKMYQMKRKIEVETAATRQLTDLIRSATVEWDEDHGKIDPADTSQESLERQCDLVLGLIQKHYPLLSKCSFEELFMILGNLRLSNQLQTGLVMSIQNTPRRPLVDILAEHLYTYRLSGDVTAAITIAAMAPKKRPVSNL